MFTLLDEQYVTPTSVILVDLVFSKVLFMYSNHINELINFVKVDKRYFSATYQNTKGYDSWCFTQFTYLHGFVHL